MRRHYYRTNVPLPAMILWWIFLGVCVVIFSIYDSCAHGPVRDAQAQWDREHFTGWRLEQDYDKEHGLFYDKVGRQTCTTKGYPGYPACPVQQYFVNGQPQASPITAPVKISH
jgi:hypothetical protein